MSGVVTSHVLGPLDLFVSGVGRIGRRVFIPSILAVVLVFEFYERAPALVHWLTGWVVYPVLMCAAASVLAKRLHDRGRSGWWSALPILAYPWIRPWPEAIFGGICLGIVLWYGIGLSLWPGQKAFNRFGERG